MSVLIDVADAVVTQLNAGTYSMDFTATRAYRPWATPADLADVKVQVVPKAQTMTPLSKVQTAYALTIDIGVQQKVGAPATPTAPADDFTKLDALTALVGEIVADFDTPRPLASLTEAILVSMANAPIYDPAHLADNGVFTSLLTLTLEVVVEHV
jgi:hypothetical protein